MYYKSLLASAVVAMAITGSAQAATVSLFSDPSHGDVGGEVANQSADLTATGNTVNAFSGTGDAAWAAALAGADAVVIPELEVDGVSDNLSASTLTAIADFVTAGGNLVTTGVFGQGLTFINDVFGTSLTGTQFVPDSSITATGLLTEFGAGPATLTSLDAVDGANLASLGGATSVYETGAFSTVFTFGFGNGNVTFLGYDWFDGQDGDWATVQDIAVNLGASQIPLPAGMPLLLAGLGAFGIARRSRKA
ncbi:VPLPA-CTERM sorting domain-containing protein [Roseovarius sp. EL26]|uniref:VPLPA-CTERM sorting domain-containing protein n=1 Tax=Roseovarius sp. EL26 TaxID=2126672 RepID=UPI000EA22BB2|nr:VPLPA-CTERM sorting domain-containing protein [Roseovarius sp. EL26]